jgi:hypothetical protein
MKTRASHQGQRAPIRHDALEPCGDAVPVVRPFGAAVPVHDPSTQHSPSAQTVPHPPQLKGSVRSSVHMPEQTEPEQVPQAPFTHDSLGAHFLPQAPQLKGSQFMSGQ